MLRLSALPSSRTCRKLCASGHRHLTHPFSAQGTYYFDAWSSQEPLVYPQLVRAHYGTAIAALTRPPAMNPPLLALKDIRKAYPAVVALDGVSLDIQLGEIHAVLGENGAGKSTLMKIIYGAVRPDAGSIEWNGQPARVSSPGEARGMGIAMVFQHFALFDSITVVENMALALPGKYDLKGLATRITEVSQRYGLPLNPWRPVHELSVGERQRVEIVRCLLQSPKLLIMDEPTSVLTPQAGEQ